MASKAIRAKATLPWPLPAVFRRSTRTPRTRDAGASCSDNGDTSELRSQAQPCECCARASSALRCVAWGRPWNLFRKSGKGRFASGDRPVTPRRSAFARRVRRGLPCVASELAKGIPARIGLDGRALAVAGVEIRAARRTKALAVFPALGERRNAEEPELANG